jgi:predicted membrane-bound mannosyltransferase
LGSNFPKGLYDSFATFKTWGGTGVREHRHNALTYLLWLWDEERWTLLPALLGFALTLRRRTNRFALFCTFWAFGMLAAYSLIPYKTPWLTLNISIPMSLVAGYACAELWSRFQASPRVRVTLLLLMATVSVCSLYQAIALSFFRYDDSSQPYVYAHTSRQIFDLLAKLDSILAYSPQGAQTGITITSPDYWPLPWYLRDNPNVGYWSHVVPTEEPIVIAAENQQQELDSSLGNRYQKVGAYDLRPGVTLVLYARRN